MFISARFCWPVVQECFRCFHSFSLRQVGVFFAAVTPMVTSNPFVETFVKIVYSALWAFFIFDPLNRRVYWYALSLFATSLWP